MKKSLIILITVVLVTAMAMAGCSKQQRSKPAQSTQSTVQSAQQSGPVFQDPRVQKYQGQDKLKQFEEAAQKDPKNVNAQMDAARSAYINNDNDKAITYYKKAIAADPKNGEAYNNLGNVYFRGKNDPKSALEYYKKATEVAPAYSFGWWNLALCEQALGDTNAAKQTVKTALEKVSKDDANYKVLEELNTKLNK